MKNRFSDLRCKEVVNVTDGCRLGYVNDLEIELENGRVLAIIVPGPCRFFGLFGREVDYVIPWPCIRRIGSDIILVDVIVQDIRKPHPKRPFF